MTQRLRGKNGVAAVFLVGTAVLLLAAAQVSAVHRAAGRQRPNVLFIVSDDLNVDLGCYGHPLVKSPHIDALARRGIRFEHAYCQYALCNPSRTSLLSGRRPATTQIFDNQTPPRLHVGDVVFLPELFGRNGYLTARAGKIAHSSFEDAVRWEVSDPTRNGGEGEGGRRGTVPLQWRATTDDAPDPDVRTARRIVEFLEKKHDRPFFIAAGFHHPHLPFVAPQRYFDLYRPERIPLPTALGDEAVPLQRRDDVLTPEQQRSLIAGYYACISFLDDQVGVIISALDRLKLAESTIIVIFGDHGFHLGEHGLWRKGTLFEEAARVPLIVVAPGKSRGVTSPRLVELVDLYPTLADLCGLPVARDLEGTSFAPLLDHPDRRWKTAAFTDIRQAETLAHRVRTERYAYSEWPDGARWLFDLDQDPGEHQNLGSDPAQADRLAEMRRILLGGWQAARPEPR